MEDVFYSIKQTDGVGKDLDCMCALSQVMEIFKSDLSDEQKQIIAEWFAAKVKSDGRTQLYQVGEVYES